MARHRASGPSLSPATVVASVALLGASYGLFRMTRAAVSRLLETSPAKWGAA